MSDFERIYQTDPSTECDSNREMHPSIELSDEEILARMAPLHRCVMKMLDRIDAERFSPIKVEEKVKDAKDKSKVVKSKAKQVNSRANKTAVARVQTKL